MQFIEKNGVDKLSIREVAKKAGVTHQAPYRHFKDREALIAALAQDGFEKMFLELASSIEKEKDPFIKMFQLSESYLTWAFHHPDHFRLMFSPSVPDYEYSKELELAANHILELVLAIVVENQIAKNIKKSDTRSIARQLWAAVHGTTLLLIDRQFKPLGENLLSGQNLVKEIVTNLINGLRPR